MKKKLLSIMLMISMLLCLVPAQNVSADGSVDRQLINEVVINQDAPAVGKTINVSGNCNISGDLLDSKTQFIEKYDNDGNKLTTYTGETYQIGYTYVYYVSVKLKNVALFSSNATIKLNGKKASLADDNITNMIKKGTTGSYYRLNTQYDLEVFIIFDKLSASSVDSLDFSMNGYEAGKQISGIDVKSSNAGITKGDCFISTSGSSLDDVQSSVIGEDTPADQKGFQANAPYYLTVCFTPNEGYDVSNLLANKVQLSDGTHASNIFLDKETMKYYVVFKLPELSGSDAPDPVQYNITVPFDVTVKQGSSIAPGKKTFELEVMDVANPDEDFYQHVSSSASIETNGVGTYQGTMTFTGTREELFNYLGDGALIHEKNDSVANWTYSDAVWYVRLVDKAAMNALGDESDTEIEDPSLELEIHKATPVKTEDGDDDYEIEDTISEKMSFVNTYTADNKANSTSDRSDKKKSDRSDKKTGEQPKKTTDAPKTSDKSMPMIWFVMMCSSVIVCVIVEKRNRRRKSL